MTAKWRELGTITGMLNAATLIFLLTVAAAGPPATGDAASPAETPGPDAFAACVVSLQRAAREQGLPESIVDGALGSVTFQSRVVELDRAQPEFTRTFASYLDRRVSDWKVAQGRLMLLRYAPLLQRLSERYGVPGRYLIAFWGMETNFGSYLGTMPTLDVLATLACDERRSELFTRELFHALRLIASGALEPESAQGSWAGAFGHMQFMPSSIAAHAVDGDGDGRIDLAGSVDDAFASAARYLADLGWQRGQRWGRRVRLADDFPYRLSGAGTALPVSEWQRHGVRRLDGGELPAAEMEASLRVPMGHRGPAFLVYDNFDAIMSWNRSESYALAVGHLADRLVGAPGIDAWPPGAKESLRLSTVESLQRRLAEAGLDPGPIDGLLGPATRAALQQFQLRHGLIADGYPGPETLAELGVTDPPRVPESPEESSNADE